MRVTQGFTLDTPIKLQLQYVTITQLIDIAENIPPEQKICGIHRIFFAPEVVKDTGKPVTAKADVWSLGTMMYMLIAGTVL